MIKITKSGKFYIAIMMIVGIVAILYPRDSLYFLSAVLFAIFLLSGNLARRNIEAVDIEFEFDKEIYANKDTEVNVYIKNSKKFIPIFLIELDILGYKSVVINILPNKTYTHKTKIKFKDRGDIKITQKDIKVCSIFPFGFVRRCLNLKFSQNLIIFAMPIEFDYKQNKSSKTDNNSQNSKQSISNKLNNQALLNIRHQEHIEIDHIRDYVIGDSPKFIHQKASAKSNRLKIKEFNLNSSSSFIIDFDSIKIDDIELKVSKVTYLVNRLYTQNIDVGFIYKDINISASKNSRLEILKTLAMIEKRSSI